MKWDPASATIGQIERREFVTLERARSLAQVIPLRAYKGTAPLKCCVGGADKA